MLREFRNRYGTTGTVLLNTALFLGVNIKSDNGSFWVSDSDYDAESKTLTIASRQGVWPFESEISDAAASAILYRALKSHFGENWLFNRLSNLFGNIRPTFLGADEKLLRKNGIYESLEAQNAESRAWLAEASNWLHNRGVSEVQQASIGFVVGGVLRRIPIASPDCVRNATSGFRTRRVTIAGSTYQLDRSAITHMLERHHPNFWNGTRATTQTFFNSHLSIDDVADIAIQVMNRNRDRVAQIGTRSGPLPPTEINGVWYVLGLNRGRIAQLYPLAGAP